MNETSSKSIDVRRLRAVLLQITNLAREASLTGCLENGRQSSIQQFNRILQMVEEQGIEVGGLFVPLSSEASFDQVGVNAAQLAGFLEFDSSIPTPPLPPQPPIPPQPPGPPGFFAPPHAAPPPPQPPGDAAGGSFNFMFDFQEMKELEKLKGLGQMIREQLPEWIKREVEEKMAGIHHPQAHTTQPAQENKGQAATSQTRHATQRLEDTATPQAKHEFYEMNMKGVRFRDTNVEDAAFNDVNINNVEFTDVNFGAVTFRDVNMAGARFHDTNFESATFHDANFANTRFHDANLHNVEFIDSNIEGLKINGIAVDELLRRARPE